MAERSSWTRPSLNWLVVFLPIAAGLEIAHSWLHAAWASPTAIFLCSAIAIIPAAGWMGHATEELAGRLGDRVSLGFVVETEKQVEAHLQGHMDRLPANDHASRAIVAQMKDDEVRHALEARQAGAVELPPPVKGLMRMAAKVMTTVAHRI